MFRRSSGLLVAIVLACLLAAPAQAAYPGGNGKIAFMSSRDGNDEIYVMNPDGSAQTRLTINLASDFAPAWSPDGQKIAFVSDRDGNDEVYVMDALGLNQTRLTNNAAFDEVPTWSPDGSKIAFISHRDTDENGYALAEIYTMSSSGGDERRLTFTGTDCGFDYYAGDYRPCPGKSGVVWSPDGAKLAFEEWTYTGCFDENGNWCGWVVNTQYLVTINAAGGARAILTGDTYPSWPDWSPESGHISFSDYSTASAYRAILVMGADGAGRRVLAYDRTNTYGAPAWSPDGTKVAFERLRSVSQDAAIFVVSVDGSGKTQLTSSGSSPDWQPSCIPPCTMPAPQSYPRPISADPILARLVPAYKSCDLPDPSRRNSIHGAPLNFPSCNPPMPASNTVKAGSKSVGYAEISVCNTGAQLPQCHESAPGFTTAMQPDVRLWGSGRDIQCRITGTPAGCSAGQDYNPNGATGPYTTICTKAAYCSDPARPANPFCAPGSGSETACVAGADITATAGLGYSFSGSPEVCSEFPVGSPEWTQCANEKGRFIGHGIRVTDRYNCGPELPQGDANACPASAATSTREATLVDIQFPVPVDCLSNPEPAIAGSNCGVNTTANALAPGVYVAGKKAVVEVGQITIWDAGPNGVPRVNAPYTDDQRFATQGIYIP
jgi:Tol biopolymer transport system component